VDAVSPGPYYAEFGPCVIENDIDVAATETLSKWLPTYLRQMEEERELDFRLGRPASYQVVLEDESFFDQQLPAVIVTSTETEGAPSVYADSVITAQFTLVVTAIVKGRTRTEARALASMTGGSIRRLMVQQGTLDGAVQGVRWKSGQVSRVAIPEESRELAAGINTFTVLVDQVAQADLGPIYPSPDPYPNPDPVGDPDTPYDPLLNVAAVTIQVDGVSPSEGG
jgi:hypothetical protein